MRRTTLAALNLVSFGSGIWFGTTDIPEKTSAKPVVLIWIFLLLLSVILQPAWAKILLIIGLPLAYWSGWSHIHIWQANHHDTFLENADFEGEAIVSDAPDVRPEKQFLTVHPLKSPITHNILLKADLYPRFSYGDHIAVHGKLIHPEPVEDFNYPLFLQKNDISAIINRPHITYLSSEWSVTKMLYAIRSAIEGHISASIPEPEASFLSGVLLGSKRAIPQDIQDELKTTGTTHVVAISGANITILLEILLRVLPLYRPRSKLYAISGIAVCISLLTGASSSVVRGASVAILGSLLRYQERKPRALGMTLIPATAMLLGNPLLLRADPGFQLSFAAYAGLLFLGTHAVKFIATCPGLKRLPEVVRSACAETSAASIGTAPVSFMLFGQANMLGLIVNPAVLWLLPAITLLGLLFISVGWISVIGMLIAIPLWFLLHLFLEIIHSFSLV
jgi:competence protein ComEC